MTKTFEWTTASGAQAKIVATYEAVMERKSLDADGYKVEGNLEPTTVGSSMVVYLNGKQVDICRDPNFWVLIDVKQPGIKKIWGLKVCFDAENAEKYERFLAELMEEGTSDEVKQYEAEKTGKKEADKRTRAQEIVEAAKTSPRNQDGSLMSEAQAAAWKRSYNNINNEGGEGYVPPVVTQEQLDRALEILGR